MSGIHLRGLALLGAVAATTAGLAQDTDRDGISDALEPVLATDPAFAEKLEVVLEHPRYEPTAERPARYDITRVRFGNVARGRWLWAIEFAEPYSFENASLILYVDADDDPATGRTDMGCEVMYHHRAGSPSLSAFAPDGSRGESPWPRVGLENGVLYICADIELNQAGGRSRFRIHVLSETVEPHQGRDSTGYVEIDGPGDSERKKVITLADQTENEGFEVTEGAELLWRIQGDPLPAGGGRPGPPGPRESNGNIILNAFYDCEREGFDYYESEYRWPAVRKPGGEGTLRVKVPKAGRFHPGVVVYDGPGRESYEMTVDGEPVGRFVAQADTNRQRLFFVSRRVEFKGGETIALRAANTPASYIVEDIVLLAERPPTLKPAYEIRNLEVSYDRIAERIRATWITTWPTTCTLHYGDEETVEEEPTQNHRVYLPELQTGGGYECFVRAETPEGKQVRSQTVRFPAPDRDAPRGTVARERIELSVQAGEGDCPAGSPLTAGIPFSEGALGSADHMRLLGSDGIELPLQARPLLQWPDGSVRVALLDAMMPLAKTTAPLTLEYGREVQRRSIDPLVRVSETDDALTVTTPSLKMEFRRRESGLFTRAWTDVAGKFGDGTLITRDDAPARIVIVDDEGNEYDTLGSPENIEVEEAGPLRAVIRLDGHHTGDGGEYFTYQVRMTFYAGLPWVRMAYRWGNDRAEPEFTKFRGIRFEMPLALGGNAGFVMGAAEPERGRLADAGARLEQMRNDKYTLTSGGAQRDGERAPGWVQASDGMRAAALVCRYFWHLYPKAISAGDGMLRLDICPEFGEKLYNDCSELDLIKLYYYLQDGRYKVRQGVTKTHEVVLVFDPSGTGWEAEQLNALTSLINEPPVLAASPDWYAATGAFGSFVPKTAGRTARYDEVCERTYNSYVGGRNSRREFGMLNFGDQWGERRVNWDNGEYDHHHTAAQMFIRSAEPKWFHLMETTARHSMDVDLCHYHTNPSYRGGSWIHSMGHTGDYFTQQYEGQWGIPRGGMSVSHTWCEGTCEYYALTGDPTAIEAARMIADHYGGTYLNNYDFANGRVPGWHLLLTMAVYRATYDPFYLNAARIIVDRTLERRTPGRGWARQLVPGHCSCQPRCRGTCSFMQGILGAGLHEYYLETADERVRQAVVDSARYCIDEMWVDEKNMFRYTSCPQSSPSLGHNDTLARLLLFAHEVSGDPKLLEIAKRSMDAGFETLSSAQHLRWTPYIVHELGEW